MNDTGANALADASPAARPRRPIRRIAAFVILAAVAGVGSYLFWRATTLTGLPVIVNPFDLEKFGTVTIPDDRNAFTFYRRAHQHFIDAPSGVMKGSYTSWSEVSKAELDNLAANRETLAIWLEGTRRDRGVQVQPRDASADTMLSPTQTLRYICRLANLEAFRREHEGDYSGAWEMYRANLRASRHSGQNGFLIERLVGIAMYESASRQAIRWSEDPKVDASLLRRALDDVQALDRLTAPISDAVRNEYFSAMNTLDDPEMRDRAVRAQGYGSRALTWSLALRHRAATVLGYVMHEPERSRRVTRLLVANWLSACDLPTVDRQERAIPSSLGPLLYRPGSGDAPPIAPEELATWYERTYYAQTFLSYTRSLERSYTRDEANRVNLIVHLAGQLYKREHGKEPETPESLVGPYLKAIPAGYVAPPDEAKTPGTTK